MNFLRQLQQSNSSKGEQSFSSMEGKDGTDRGATECFNPGYNHQYNHAPSQNMTEQVIHSYELSPFVFPYEPQISHNNAPMHYLNEMQYNNVPNNMHNYEQGGSVYSNSYDYPASSSSEFYPPQQVHLSSARSKMPITGSNTIPNDVFATYSIPIPSDVNYASNINFSDRLPFNVRQVESPVESRSVRKTTRAFSSEDEVKRKRSISEPSITRSPNISKSKKKRCCARWTEEENKRLIEAYIRNEGKNWSSIAKYVGNKTSDQCNQHWHRVLNPAISKKPWSEEEDLKLIKRARDYGQSSWKKISEGLHGRTDLQCRHRWTQLKKNLGQKLLVISENLAQDTDKRSSPRTLDKGSVSSQMRMVSPPKNFEPYQHETSQALPVLNFGEYYDQNTHSNDNLIQQMSYGGACSTQHNQYGMSTNHMYLAQQIDSNPMQYNIQLESNYHHDIRQQNESPMSSSVNQLNLECPSQNQFPLLHNHDEFPAAGQKHIHVSNSPAMQVGYLGGIGVLDSRHEDQLPLPPMVYIRNEHADESDAFMNNNQFDIVE